MGHHKFKKLGFTPCKDEELLRGTELAKYKQKETRKMSRKNAKMKGVY